MRNTICLLLLLVTIGLASDTTMIKKVILFFGFTQTGKSSTVKDLTGDQSIVCGNGSGQSTTKTVNIYKAINPKLSDYFIFMDTIGLGDNTLRSTPQKIREEIQMNILSLSNIQKCDEIQGIVITQSIKDSSFQLPNTLQFITEIFGYVPKDSIVVIGTKSQNEEPEDIQIRQNMIKQKMRQFGIPQGQYMRFATTYKGLKAHQIDQQQYVELENRLKKCTKIDATSIQNKLSQINARTLVIQKQKTVVQRIPYTHTWTQYISTNWFRKLFFGRRTVVKSEIRYNTVTYVPPLTECYKAALIQFETKIRQKLLVMQ